MESGTKLGPYEILEQLGAGGMGEVYLAQDTRLGRQVAVKVLPAEFAADPERLARFEQEARASAALNHPNIAAVFDVGQAPGPDGETTHYMVQELLGGHTLRATLEAGPLPLKRTLALATEIAEALRAAHKAGIVHRDLKPDNVFVSEDGHAKVLDFGLAKLTEAEGAPLGGQSMSPTVLGTQAGAIMGTAGYMAPEQVEGREVDARADLFAFGCVVYEMAAGKQPFRGQNVYETLGRIVSNDPEPLQTDSAPPELQRILRKCLAKDPAERAQSAGDLVVDLRLLASDVESGTAEAVAGAGPVQASATADRPHGVAPAVVAIVAAAAVALGALIMWLTAGGAVVDRDVLELDIGLAGGTLDEVFGPGAMLSPDGRWIAMAVEGLGSEGGRASIAGTGIALRSLSSGTLEWLVEFPADNPVFSLDSQWLAYEQDGILNKIPVAGGAPIRLVEAPSDRGTAWLSDGSMLVVPTAGDGIYRLPAEGGELVPVTTLGEGEAAHRWPQVLPGEQRALFTADTDGLDWSDATIEMVDLATGARDVLLRGGYFPRYVETGHILYASGATLYALPFDLDRLEVTGASFRVIEGLRSNSAVGSAQFSLSNDGSLLYLPGEDTSTQFSMRLIVTDRAGEPALFGASVLAEENSAGLILNPTVSPDGTRVAHVRSNTGGDGDVWIYDAARGISSRLTLSNRLEWFPVWSPDGKQIYYALSSGDVDEVGVYRRNADGSGDAERVIADADTRVWDVSTDGRTLIVGNALRASLSVERGLYQLDLESGERRLIPNTSAGFAVQARLSPDGRWLVFAAAGEGLPGVYVVSLEGEGRWQISDGLGAQPLFSNDGTEIFYRSDRNLMSVPIAPEGNALRPGRPRVLLQMTEGSTLGVAFAGSFQYDYGTLDGQSFIQAVDPLTQNEGREQRGILVLNWLERLRRMATAQD